MLLSEKVNKMKRDQRILLLVHVRFSSQIYYNFFIQKISSIGRSRMERSPKRGKHPGWQEMMLYVPLSSYRDADLFPEAVIWFQPFRLETWGPSLNKANHWKDLERPLVSMIARMIRGNYGAP